MKCRLGRNCTAGRSGKFRLILTAGPQCGKKELLVRRQALWDNDEMKIQQLNHVAIHVEDVARSCQFYGGLLQLEPLPRPAFTFPGAWFRLGVDQELHIIGERKDPVYSKSRGNHFALMVDDIDAWQQHLTAQKCEYAPRQTRPDGAYQIFLRDPDGHSIELCTLPGIAHS